jgi:ABC-type uncharacterized transport system substrate-binding protein
MKRREFITSASAALAFSFAAQAEQLPVVAFVNGGAPDASAPYLQAFRKGLSESGNAEGRDFVLETYWLADQLDRISTVVEDLVRRNVALIASPGFPAGSLAAKKRTAVIPVVFGVGDDPVKLGLVSSAAKRQCNGREFLLA